MTKAIRYKNAEKVIPVRMLRTHETFAALRLEPNALCKYSGGMVKKTVFLDIDGTLIPWGQANPGAEDIAQIEQAHNDGHLFFLSTARSLACIPAVLTRSPWVDGIVAAAGAQVLLRNGAEFTTVYRNKISGGLLSAMCELYPRLEKWCVFEGETELYSLGTVTNLRFPRTFLVVESKDDFLTKYRNAAIGKVTVDGGIIGVEQKLLEGDLQVFSQPEHHEWIIRGESKAKGMRIALEAAGAERENSIAIGDSTNDLDMIRFAGTGIAMGNACDELKAAAAYTTGDVDHGGIAQALRKYLGGF